VSKSNFNSQKITTKKISSKYRDAEKISMITCYDSSFARIINETEIDMVLVGDSLGNVMMGHENTLKVTVDDMIHHSASVARSLEKALICTDMPFMSYQISIEEAVRNAGKLVQEGGAEAVKLEGGAEVADCVSAISNAGIPVVGHLGLTPQSVHKLGGYSVQGRGEAASQALISDAQAIEKAGAFALVLEMVPAELAKKVTEILSIPTIGIGAGVGCSGQVLVLQDMLGFDDSFNPKFLKKYLNLGSLVREAISAFDSEVKEGVFPTDKNSFSS
jgi:3-methyl-2-oxobutanoate hydroxymethyltransferase